MEAMSCGVPCVGFDVGGIPEMIDHLQNGYVARYKDAASLAEGIAWTLDKDNNGAELSRRCIHKVHATYAQQHVAKCYLDVYQEAIDNGRRL